MSRRGGKRRQIVQLNDNKSSKLHRYGYSKELHSGKVEQPNLVSSYDDSESEEDKVDEILSTDTPEATTTSAGDDGIDNELRNFLSEIEAIPMPDDKPSKPVSFGTSSENSWKLNTFQEAKVDDDNATTPEEVIEDEKVEVVSEKKKTNAYSMFVKGEIEFADSPKNDTKSLESEQIKDEAPSDKETSAELPDEPETAWQMVQDETSQYYYYWNTVTNEVTWEIPSEYTQYLLLHREYTERISKYSKEELESLKEKKERKSKKDQIKEKDIPGISSRSQEAIKIDMSRKKEIENNLSSEEASIPGKHERRKKKSKKHKHKRDENNLSESENRKSPIFVENPVMGPNLPSIDSSTEISSANNTQDVNSKKGRSTTGSGLLGMGAYLSDQEDSDIDQSDPLPPQLGLAVDNVFPVGKDVNDKEEAEMPVLGAATEEGYSEKKDIVIGSSKALPHLSPHPDNEEFAVNDVEKNHVGKESELDRTTELKLTGNDKEEELDDLLENIVCREEKNESESSDQLKDIKEVDILPENISSKSLKLSTASLDGNDLSLKKGTMEEGELPEGLDSVDSKKKSRSSQQSNYDISSAEEKSNEIKKRSALPLSIVASYGTDDEEEGELKDSDSERIRKRKKDKKDKRKDEKKRKYDENRSSSGKKESDSKRRKDSNDKYSHKSKDEKDKIKARKDKERVKDESKPENQSKVNTERQNTKSNEDKSSDIQEGRKKNNEDQKKNDEEDNVKLLLLSSNDKMKNDEIRHDDKDNGEHFKKPSAVNESTDIDFDDLDDLDRALEMALEKKKFVEKKVVVEEKVEESQSDMEPVKKDLSTNVTSQPTEDDLEEGETKASSEVDEEDTKIRVKEMADLAINKLEFLDLGTDNLSRLQITFVELQTRLTDWTAGGLSTSYFLQQLLVAEGLLTEYELSAVPNGWACQWDRANNRYYYRNKVTDRIQWEYPEAKDEKQRKKESRKDRDGDNSSDRKSRGSRHRKREDRDKDRDKDRSKHEKRSRSDRHRRKRRRHRDHSSSSVDSQGSQQVTSSKRQHKSKKKKRQRSRTKSRSVSVEVVQVKEADPIEVRDESPPPMASSEASPAIPESLTPLPSSPAPPPSPLPETPPPPTLLAISEEADCNDGNSESVDGEKMETDNGDVPEDLLPEEEKGVKEEEVNTAVISRPPVITKPLPHVVAMQPPELYIAPPVIAPPPEANIPVDDAPSLEMQQPIPDTEKQVKKKKKDKKLATGSNIMMKKKHMSSMVQKWQKVKKEVEKEEKDKEAREAAIRQKIADLK